MSQEIFYSAEKYIENNLSLIIIDKEKQPPVIGINSSNEEIRFGWKKYQTERMDFFSFMRFFKDHKAHGVGVICGEVSGGLECLDIDCKNDKSGTLWENFLVELEDQAPNLIQCFYIEKSVNNGYHLVYRLRDEKVSGNQVLASNEDKEVLIETRGEGGYFACAPTQGYSVFQGSLEKIPVISEDEHETLLNVAKTFDCIPEENDFVYQHKINENYEGLTPFDDYNDDYGNMFDLLESKGWVITQGRNGSWKLRRPNKQTGISATFNQKNKKGLPNRFYLFSSSVKEIPKEKLLKPSAVYTFLEHNGDFAKAAKALYRKGYGDRLKKKELQFWTISHNEKKDTYNLSINHDDFLNFVSSLGFAPMFLPSSNESIFIQVKENIVKEVSPQQIKEAVLEEIENLPEILDEKSGITQKQLRELLIVKEKTFFCDTKLQCIHSVQIKFNRDTSDSSFFYFKNGFVCVTKRGIQFNTYDILEGAIWNTQIVDRDYTPYNSGGMYEEFIFNVTNKDSNRNNALKTAIGYLLHRYKNPSNCKAIILNDEVVSDSSEGGTGKSLIANAICQLRKVSKIDGKDFSFDNKFAFGCVGLDTDMITFDDIQKDFDFERLFHKITDGLSIEEKNVPKIRIKAEDSPKFLITTNYVLKGENFSSNRRKAEYELAPYYGKDRTPLQEFKKNFFYDWDSSEWAQFDFFMLNCVRMFLTEGLLEVSHTNLEYKKARQETHQDFSDWVHFYFSQHSKDKPFEEPISVLFNAFIEFSEEHKQLSEMNKFRQEKFTTWLKLYFRYFKSDVLIERKRMGDPKTITDKENRVRTFFCKTIPEQFYKK